MAVVARDVALDWAASSTEALYVNRAVSGYAKLVAIRRPHQQRRPKDRLLPPPVKPTGSAPSASKRRK